MITTLIVWLCSTQAMDDCQARAYQQWNDSYSQYECLASIEPTLDELRKQAPKAYIKVYCESE